MTNGSILSEGYSLFLSSIYFYPAQVYFIRPVRLHPSNDSIYLLRIKLFTKRGHCSSHSLSS